MFQLTALREFLGHCERVGNPAGIYWTLNYKDRTENLRRQRQLEVTGNTTKKRRTEEKKNSNDLQRVPLKQSSE